MPNFITFRIWFLLFLFAQAVTTLVRAQNAGRLDPGFDAGAGLSSSPSTRPLGAWQSDGKLVLLGSFSPWPGIVRVNRDGTVDRTFEVGTGFGFANGTEPVAIATQADDKILVGGFFPPMRE